MKFIYDVPIDEGIDMIETKYLESYLSSKKDIINEIFSVGDIDEIWKLSKMRYTIFGFSLNFILSNISELSKLKVKYYCTDFPKSLTDVEYQVKTLNCYAILLYGELCFNIDRISKYCHDNDIYTICYLNKNQNYYNDKNKLGFFVRPNDIDIYEPFIDYGIILNNTRNPKSIPSVYKNKEFLNDLRLIIKDLGIEIDNSNIKKDFGLSRSKCRYKCCIGECKLCEIYMNFSNALTNKELRLK